MPLATKASAWLRQWPFQFDSSPVEAAKPLINCEVQWVTDSYISC